MSLCNYLEVKLYYLLLYPLYSIEREYVALGRKYVSFEGTVNTGKGELQN